MGFYVETGAKFIENPNHCAMSKYHHIQDDAADASHAIGALILGYLEGSARSSAVFGESTLHFLLLISSTVFSEFSPEV